jgi:DNA-binding transcriptional MerR regulator
VTIDLDEGQLISEIAESVGADVGTLRAWIGRGHIEVNGSIKRGVGRKFDREQAVKIRMLFALTSAGISMKVAKQILQESGDGKTVRGLLNLLENVRACL